MENATKALLIAAAILVAILIISLGLVVYNMAAEAIQGVDISATELKAHNDQYIRYEGESQSGSTVNAMLQTVMQNNLKEKNEGKKVTVYYQNTSSVRLATNATSSPSKFDTGKSYDVEVLYDDKTGFITGILVDDVT